MIYKRILVAPGRFRLVKVRCTHRGDLTGEVRRCPVCNNSTNNVEFYRCAVYGKCTETVLLPQIHCCAAGCPERQDVEVKS